LESVSKREDTRRKNMSKEQMIFQDEEELNLQGTTPNALVINYVSLIIILIGMMVSNFNSKIIKIETAFLHSSLMENVYMEIPSGMEVGNGNVLF
jgi:uncharacterized Tic20 family protein